MNSGGSDSRLEQRSKRLFILEFHLRNWLDTQEQRNTGSQEARLLRCCFDVPDSAASDLTVRKNDYHRRLEYTSQF
jgi:hypothetical protein